MLLFALGGEVIEGSRRRPEDIPMAARCGCGLSARIPLHRLALHPRADHEVDRAPDSAPVARSDRPTLQLTASGKCAGSRPIQTTNNLTQT